MKKVPLFFVLLGGPGSGKGTHGQALADAFQFHHLSTGAHFRRHIAKRTPLGILAQSFIAKGQLVPDDVATSLLKDLLGELPPAEGYILDGYPRSQVQARDLKQILAEKETPLAAALYLKISDAEIIRRLSRRLTCHKCERTFHEIFNPPPNPKVCPSCGGELYRRDDDHPETIKKRLTVFHQSVGPLLEFYRQENLLQEIDAEGAPPEVKALVVEAAEKAIAARAS